MVNSATIKSPAEQKAPEASSTTNTAEGSFVNMLSQTLTAANAYLVSLLSQAGLKDLVPSHGDILVALFAQETITMQELSEKIHRDPSTITALVKKLVLGGYVQTQKSVTDKRRTEVSSYTQREESSFNVRNDLNHFGKHSDGRDRCRCLCDNVRHAQPDQS